MKPCGCEHDPPEAARLLTRSVNTIGWHVVNVRSDGLTPEWAYTIGLYHNFRHPEIVVIGLARDVVCDLVQIFGRQVRDGESFHSGRQYGGYLCGHNVLFKRVLPRWAGPVLAWATWWYGGTDFPAIQGIWPDYRSGWYPWQRGYPRESWFKQPLLFHADPDRARVGSLFAAPAGSEAMM